MAGGIEQEDVLWFKISVDKSERMQVRQRTAQLGDHPLATVLLHANLGTLQITKHTV